MNRIYKAASQYLSAIYKENFEDILVHTIISQKGFSACIAILFFLYTTGALLANRFLWEEWLTEMFYGYLISGIAAVNWLLLQKRRIPKEKTIFAANGFLFLLLQALVLTRCFSEGYISYVLTTCTILSTAVVCLHPPQYILQIFLAEGTECILTYFMMDYPLNTTVYYWMDSLIIFIIAVGINFLISILRYQLLDEKSELKKETSIDALTGVYTRKYFERYFHLHHREDELSAMMHIDLDNFKTLNDTLGHQQGDTLLIQAAELLREHFRKMDCVARVGGDEFMIFMASLTETKPAFEKVQKILNCFPIVVEENGKKVPVSVSMGVVFSPKNKDIPYHELYELADTAMYRAKKGGKGRAFILGFDGAEDALLLSENTQ